MPGNHYQRIARHLTHHTEDWAGAFNLIPFFLRNMYLSAYQSHLWNSILSEWISATGTPENLITIEQKQGKLPMLKQVTSGLDLEIPLPSSRYYMADYGSLVEHVIKVLAQEQLELKDIKLKHFREPFFSKGTRAAWYVPGEFSHELGWDKLHKGHRKVKLNFTLPRGCYATMLVKRLRAR
jgi:tRNA pseudouridine13 synthase